MNRASRAANETFRRRTLLYRAEAETGSRVDAAPCEAGEALTVFSFGHAPDGFLRFHGLEDWFMGTTSPGELISLLCGPYASISWVALDPHAQVPLQEDIHATIVDHESFVAILLRGTGER